MTNIIAISTDGAPVYSGEKFGMVKILKNSNEINKNVVYLPDLCHKMECLSKEQKSLLNTCCDIVSIFKKNLQ